jgi:hypothetical protein
MDMSHVPDPSPQAAALYKKYLTDAPITPEELKQRLATYLEFVAKVSQVNTGVDHGLAQQIAQRLEELADAPPEKFKFVQAAARYFTEDEDAEGDLVSAGGFNDDIAVLNALCRHLGRPDLQLL